LAHTQKYIIFPGRPFLPRNRSLHTFSTSAIAGETAYIDNSIKQSLATMPFPSPTKASYTPDSGVESSPPKGRRNSNSTVESLESLPDMEVDHQRYPTKGPQNGPTTIRKRVSNACDYCQLKKSKVRIAPNLVTFV
jgi:hypothetical protein